MTAEGCEHNYKQPAPIIDKSTKKCIREYKLGGVNHFNSLLQHVS